MTIIAEKQCAATPHPLRGWAPEGRGGYGLGFLALASVSYRRRAVACTIKNILSAKKLLTPPPTPPLQGEWRTSETILQGRGAAAYSAMQVTL